MYVTELIVGIGTDLATNISRIVRSIPEYVSARNIACYLHMASGEVETSEIIRNAFNDGKRVFLPKIIKLDVAYRQYAGQTTELRMLEVMSMEDISKLQPQGRFKLREPNSGCDAFEAGGIDLIILPGMAFTKECTRLGHGMGYYDSFISKYVGWAGKSPALVAIGLEQQLVDEIPYEPHDKVLDAVIMNNQLYRAGSK
jgi:5-formyltetrahydrofolate cyclo-ligase